MWAYTNMVIWTEVHKAVFDIVYNYQKLWLPVKEISYEVYYRYVQYY
jgi:hypothetical protein